MKKLPGKAPERVVYLTLTTWTESCITWAEHWYGRLKQRKDGHERNLEVDRILTAKDAKQLNESEHDPTAPPYKAGERTGRFFSRDAVIKAALECWQEHWPKADILILGDPLTLDPQEVLVGPEPLKTKINEIVHLCHTTNYYHAVQLSDEHKALRRRWLDLWVGKHANLRCYR